MRSTQSSAYNILVNWLISQRLLNGLTQEQLSKKINKPQSYISKIETFKRRIDLIETIEICTSLGVSIKELINLLAKGKNK
jgi:transcriptional regulator with XRE-family HTH domain